MKGGPQASTSSSQRRDKQQGPHAPVRQPTVSAPDRRGAVGALARH